jgi:hypothetical protein
MQLSVVAQLNIISQDGHFEIRGSQPILKYGEAPAQGNLGFLTVITKIGSSLSSKMKSEIEIHFKNIRNFLEIFVGPYLSFLL